MVTELSTHTHTQIYVAAAGVHAQRRREIHDSSTRTAAVTTRTHPHSNYSRMGLHTCKEVVLAQKGGRQKHRGRRHATRQSAAADDWLVRAHCFPAQR